MFVKACHPERQPRDLVPGSVPELLFYDTRSFGFAQDDIEISTLFIRVAYTDVGKGREQDAEAFICPEHH